MGVYVCMRVYALMYYIYIYICVCVCVCVCVYICLKGPKEDSDICPINFSSMTKLPTALKLRE
jgi:hypothetical protein